MTTILVHIEVQTNNNSVLLAQKAISLGCGSMAPFVAVSQNQLLVAAAVLLRSYLAVLGIPYQVPACHLCPRPNTSTDPSQPTLDVERQAQKGPQHKRHLQHQMSCLPVHVVWTDKSMMLVFSAF